VLVAKPFEKDCFSNSGLATDEHQLSFGACGDGEEQLGKRRKMIGSLEQLARLVRQGCSSIAS
jgi:hypothetical protein